jgi:hypothetical protein
MTTHIKTARHTSDEKKGGDVNKAVLGKVTLAGRRKSGGGKTGDDAVLTVLRPKDHARDELGEVADYRGLSLPSSSPAAGGNSVLMS